MWGEVKRGSKKKVAEAAAHEMTHHANISPQTIPFFCGESARMLPSRAPRPPAPAEDAQLGVCAAHLEGTRLRAYVMLFRTSAERCSQLAGSRGCTRSSRTVRLVRVFGRDTPDLNGYGLSGSMSIWCVRRGRREALAFETQFNGFVS